MPDEAPQNAPAEGAEQDQNKPAEPSGTGTTTPAETVNWQERFEGQQKVNRDLEAKLKAALPKDEAEELRAKIAKLEGKEAEYVAQTKEREVEQAALSKANERVTRRAIREHAATRLRDAGDALLYLDLADFQVDQNGDVDDAAVIEAIEALVKSKPYLAAEGGAGPVIHSPTSHREGPTSKRQWTKADLQGKSPDQINAARAEGLLDDLLGGKTN